MLFFIFFPNHLLQNNVRKINILGNFFVFTEMFLCIYLLQDGKKKKRGRRKRKSVIVNSKTNNNKATESSTYDVIDYSQNKTLTL